MKLPDFKYEKELWGMGRSVIAGCDEVGRGSFAGPVVAGCVIFPRGFKSKSSIIINDSKKLNAPKRELADIWIKKNALAWGVGEASVAEINIFGVGKAANIAFRRAIAEANNMLSHKVAAIEHLLVDAFYIPKVKCLPKSRQTAMIKGDQKSFSIAAASIIAKVYRDKLMKKLGREKLFKKYKWIQNVGYGTKFHREIILKHGITIHHRKVFVQTFVGRLTNT